MSESTDPLAGMTTAEQADFDAMRDDAPEPTGQVADSASEPTEQQREQRDRHVPYPAFHAEREQKKELAAENARLRDERARFDERLKVLQELQEPQRQPQQDAMPDIDTDARGYLQWVARQTQQTQQALQERAHQDHQTRQVAELQGWAVQQEQSFRAATPDWDAAAAFMKNSRIEELRELGVPEDRIAATVQNDMLMVAHQARQNGANPAQRLYNLAKRRGYQPSAASENGAEVQAEAIQRGQRLSSGAGGGGATGSITANQLLAMSSEEFNAFKAKSPRKFQELMGE